MQQPSHQIVRLSAGSHHGPEHGACVMELASMLAGEPFTDRPATVCPVIAAFLRTYNDDVDSRRRQDLYRFASEAVGTRGSDALEERRAELLRRWVQDAYPEVAGRPARLVPRRWRAWGTKDHQQAGMVAGRLASYLVRRERPGGHEAALALIEQLIACTPPDEPEPAGQPEGAPLPTASPNRSSPTAPLMPRVP